MTQKNYSWWHLLPGVAKHIFPFTSEAYASATEANVER